MNRKIKLSLITLLGIGSISIASLPLVSCGNSETIVPPTTPGQDLKEITGITLVANPAGLTYAELQVTPITIDTVKKLFNGIDETNYKQFDISMSDTTGKVTMDLTAKEGFVFPNNQKNLKSSLFDHPLSTMGDEDIKFMTSDGINIQGHANGTASIIESSTTYTGSLDLVIKDSYVATNSKVYTITTIGDYAFSSSKLITLDLSKNTSLTSIGESAFSSSELITLDLSQNTLLTSIGDNAFMLSKLTTLDLSKNTLLRSISGFHNSLLTTLDLSQNTSLTNIGMAAFHNSLLTTLDLSQNTSLTTIGLLAFYYSPLTVLKIPDSVTTIRTHAFNATKNIERANLKLPSQFMESSELTRIGITII